MSAIIKKHQSLQAPKIIAYCGFFIMTSFIFYAMVYGDFLIEGSILTSMPWGIVSLVDIYLGLIIFSSWVFWREENKSKASLWIILILTLGNAISCLYILKAVYESEGNIIYFWISKKKAGVKYVR